MQNFVSAGVGMAVLAAVVRGISRRSPERARQLLAATSTARCVYILLPLAVVLAVILVSQGVVQTFHGHATATTLEGAQQTIARGPAASQIAIKQLGTNGGGFYNSNSAVPFENPNGLTNFLEVLAILLIPAAQVFMFGKMVLARRHALMVFAAMFAIFAIGVAIALPSEQHGSQVLRASGVNITQGNGQSGGNMSDKEVRFGIANTALWATATTDASNGSVNGGHDAFTAAGGAVPLVNIFLGEVVFGGVGSGLYGMFFYILIAVFVAGLMVGRTPEWLGKKIEAREIKLAALGALFVPTMVLALTALAVVTKGGLASIYNPGAHGFTRVALRLHLAVEQQRQRVRGLRRDELLRELRRNRDVPRALRAAAGGARDRRLARGEEDRPRLRRHVPHRRPDVRRPARRRDRADGRPDDLPGAHARPDRRGADALMLRDLRASVIAIVLLTAAFGFAYPAVMTGFAQIALKHKANGSLIDARRQGRRLGARGAGVQEPALLPRAPVGHLAGLQRRRDDVREPRADEP